MTYEVEVGIDELDVAWTMAIHPHGDQHISEALRREGVWEPFESLVVARLLGTTPESVGPNSVGPPLFVDCGANIGWYSLLAASSGAYVVAAEPMPANAALLRHNVAAAGFDSIEVHECALGAGPGSAELHLSATNQGDHRLHTDDPWDVAKRRTTVRVAVRPLSDCLHGRRPNLVKLDTQGSEVAILMGALDAWQPRVGAADVSIVSEFWPYGLDRCGSSASAFIDLVLPLVGSTHRCFELIEP